jgi:hypothetical protein
MSALLEPNHMGEASSSWAVGPVEFLKRRAAKQLAAAKRFHEAAGVALDAAMEAALDDLPRLYIPLTRTEGHLADVVRFAGRFHASAGEALESIQGARLEADLAFREEMALDREERLKEWRAHDS